MCVSICVSPRMCLMYGFECMCLASILCFYVCVWFAFCFSLYMCRAHVCADSDGHLDVVFPHVCFVCLIFVCV